ncbi:MAG: tRNA uridine(34) 5-carboxymethylaminomethyl modification radical SAM/GNAT enzyme Elp3 [Candidatus Thorarchaeota archaeon]|nr:MAG: tRNA uridine(34) 5-carboxymethylaminomethyl modification radical SAM/GNAT enzyme Elp3 [Candidatus Thorarchaeota archaeon]
MSESDYEFYRAIIDALLSSEKVLTRQTINQIKNKICSKFKKQEVPTNADVLLAAVPEELEILRPLMRKRPVRTVSGVSVVAVMTEPHKCPHGKCAYCPGGPDAGVPQSYTGHEPATMRGLQHEFDPFRQVQGRLDQLQTIGHSVEKTELIVMGGDWCSKPAEYREWFVKSCFDAMNGVPSPNLEATKQANETASVRNIGLTFETRPDWVSKDTVDEMLRMGATRVELGVQSLSDRILANVQRGHGVEATIKATKTLRDSGLKVCYHMMPGLPGSSVENDLSEFSKLFQDPRFRPDMLKLYPTIVVKNTELYDWWVSGKYKPYETDVVVDLAAKAISRMPEYVRIQRMQRDIPLHQIEAGLNKGNLRELVHRRMLQMGLRNPTIRYREVGHFQMRSEEEIDPDKIQAVRREYDAGDGTEVFLSFEEPDLDVIFGFLRLRIPSEGAHRPEITDRPCALIRELRVYGPVVEIGDRDPEGWQHRGMGEEMISMAEDTGRDEFGAQMLLVNSGLGVKGYYRSLGFRDAGPYLEKEL